MQLAEYVILQLFFPRLHSRGGERYVYNHDTDKVYYYIDNNNSHYNGAKVNVCIYMYVHQLSRV